MVASILLGTHILALFGIGGGLLLAAAGWRMLHHTEDDDVHSAAAEEAAGLIGVSGLASSASAQVAHLGKRHTRISCIGK